MSARTPLRSSDFLVAADDKSRKYEWMDAANLYQRILDQFEPNTETYSTIHVIELQAGCYYRAAFQPPSRHEFVERMKLAEHLYRKAAEISGENGKETTSRRAMARGLFARFWLEEDQEERRRIVQRCISLSNETAKLLQSSDDGMHVAEIHADIISYSREAYHLAREWRDKWTEYNRTLQAGRTAITKFGALGDGLGLLQALHSTLWMLAVEAEGLLEPSKFHELAGETVQLGKKLAEEARKIGTPYALFMANEALGDIAWDVEGNPAGARVLYQQALTFARETKDSLAIGRLLAVLTTLQHWMAMTGEHAGERREAIEKGLAFATEAIARLKIPFHTSYLARTHSNCAGCYIDLADLVETDPAKKKSPPTTGN